MIRMDRCKASVPGVPLYVTRASLPPLEEYVREISCMWESHWLTNMGQKHEKLREELECYLGVNRCVLFGNGHSALEATLLAMGLEGEVITTPYTFSSTTHAIVRAGLVPIMCDVKREDGTLDPACIEPLITSRTCAILPVHVYGNVCDVDAIAQIAQRHGLRIVYDAAHAFGVRVNDVPVVTYGNASILSFHATKVFNSVEGGAVCVNNDEALCSKLELLRNFGIVDEDEVAEVGFNAKMSEFHASMGLCNLRHHSHNVELRRSALSRYRDRLCGVRGLRFVSGVDNVCANGFSFTSNAAYCAVAVSEEFGMDRDALRSVLASNGIFARRYFYPCTNDYACYKGMFDPCATPVARQLSKQVLCLPLFAGMTIQEVDYVCDVVLGACDEL